MGEEEMCRHHFYVVTVLFDVILVTTVKKLEGGR